MKFESQRLCFRELADGDIENLSQLLKDPKVMEYCEGALDYKASQRWLKSVQKYYKSLGYDYWAAVHKESGEFVGQMGIIKQEVDGEWIDCVAFMVNSKEWGKGYATEGAGACIQYAFDVLNHQKIYATVEKE
ncbi:MAG: GNAT family N-acetyltransferase, partial [Vallitaleaceae bacterium]|nr:GNAT family N-acetyltransferase [Vallitaleaceae bacterium]